MTKLHESTVSKMSLIQPLMFTTLKMGCFKMPNLQTAGFEMVVTVASGLSMSKTYEKI